MKKFFNKEKYLKLLNEKENQYKISKENCSIYEKYFEEYKLETNNLKSEKENLLKNLENINEKYLNQRKTLNELKKINIESENKFEILGNEISTNKRHLKKKLEMVF